jgi:chemotaxis protein methyltransferase CheR
MGHFAFDNLRIDATDVENTGQFAQMIEAGVYTKEELSRLPEGILEKYFAPDGKPGLLSPDRQHPAPGRFSAARSSIVARKSARRYLLVLCKNVLLHFQPPERIEVLRMFHRALAPGGFVRHRADPGHAAGTRTLCSSA